MSPELPEPRSFSGCGQCVDSRCCRSFEPALTLADLRRLATLGLAPSQVARLRPGLADELGPEGVQLAAGGTFELVLTHQPHPLGKACLFYVGIDAVSSDKHQRGRCGVYGQRPMLCRLFPSVMTPLGVWVDTPEAVCPPGSFSQTRADLRTLSCLHQYAQDEQSEWQHWLQTWNASPREEADFWKALTAALVPV